MEASIAFSLWDVAVLLAVIGVLLNTALIGFIWSRQDSKRNQVANLDTRVTVLEQRIAGIGEVKVRVDAVATDVTDMAQTLAALRERGDATWEMVSSIQEYLRGSK